MSIVTGDEKRAIMYEMRADMLEDDAKDVMHEMRMRSDSEYFFDKMSTKYSSGLIELKQTIKNECEHYGQDFDYWFPYLLQN